VDVRIGSKANGATIITSSYGAALKQSKPRARRNSNEGICTTIHTSKNTRSAIDWMAGSNGNPAVSIKGLQGATLIGGKTIDFGTIGNKTANARALWNIDIHHIVSNHPPCQEHLLFHVKSNMRSFNAWIRCAKWITVVLALHFKCTSINGEQFGGLNITRNSY